MSGFKYNASPALAMIPPAIREWVDDCLVPNLVKQLMAEHEKGLDGDSNCVTECASDTQPGTEAA